MKPTSVSNYLDTILRTGERVIATNVGLKTSDDLALVSRGKSIKFVLCNVYYVSYSIIKCMADGCPCMLVP